MASRSGSPLPALPAFAARGRSPGRVLPRPAPGRRAIVVALALIVLAGLALRAAQAADPGRYRSSDERSYARLALSLAGGEGYAPDGISDPWRWAPGAPALFAAGHLLAGGLDGDDPGRLRSAFWAQALVGGALIVVVFLLAAGLAGPPAGLIAAALVASYPPLVRATGDLVSEPLGALTLALAMLAVLGAWRRPDRPRLVLAGALLGAALLVRADLLFLPAALGGVWWLAARPRAGGRAALRQAGVIALVPLLVAAPWIAYASSRAGRLVPVAGSGPATLFVGTYLPGEGKLIGVKRDLEPYVRRQLPNLHATPITSVQGNHVLQAYIRERHPDLKPGTFRPIPEEDMRGALAHETRRNLRLYLVGRPLDFAAMELRKVARLWGGYYVGGTRNPRPWILVWHRWLLVLALAGAACGLLAARRRRAELALLLVPVLMSTIVNVVFVAQPRHNLRVLPLLVVAGCAGLVLGLQALARRRAGHGLPPEADPPGDRVTAGRTTLPAPAGATSSRAR